MLPEDIDSLFRNQLDGHQSAPGDDLWARLQAQLPATPEAADAAPAAEPNRLDELFRARLSEHRTLVPRELWERLEDEHLRPRKRRAAAWWPLAIAASVALFLLVGGGLLWLGIPGQHQGSAGIAGVNQQGNAVTENPSSAAQVDANPTAKTPAGAIAAAEVEAIKKNVAIQATDADRLSSSAPEGHGTAPRRPTTRSGQSVRAAATYATLAPERARQSGPAATRSSTAAHQPTTGVAPVAPVPEQPVVAQHTPAPASADAEVIEVEVRRGGSPAPVVAVAAAPAPPADDASAGGQGLGRQLGGLFHHAKGAVRLAKSGLAVAQNIPDNLTVQAHVGHRTLSKTIEL